MSCLPTRASPSLAWKRHPPSGGVVYAEDIRIILIHPEDGVHLLPVLAEGRDDARRLLDALYTPTFSGNTAEKPASEFCCVGCTT